DDFVGLVPARAHEAAQAALTLIVAPLALVLDDHRPGIDGAVGDAARRAPVREQTRAHHRVLHAVGAVQVPRVGSAAGTAARLVVGQVGTGARVVGLLR